MMSFGKFLFFNNNARRQFTLPLLAGAVLIAVLWKLGFLYNLYEFNYYHILGYDKVLHTLGGAWWAIFGIALYCMYRDTFDRFFLSITRQATTTRTPHIMRSALLWALMIGAAWELLEYSLPWLRNYLPLNPIDTLTDLIVYDMLGGYIVGLLYRKHVFTPTPIHMDKTAGEMETG